MPDSLRHEVVLRDDQSNGSSHLSVAVKESWDLVFSGHILSQALEDTLGDSEYEYWLTVRSEHVPTVLLELIKEHFKDDGECERWLQSKGIPSERYSWF